MWNKENYNFNTFLNNPVNGIIQKSNPNSFFVKMKTTSENASQVFSKNPKLVDIEVIVLQVLILGNEWLLVELVDPKLL